MLKDLCTYCGKLCQRNYWYGCRLLNWFSIWFAEESPDIVLSSTQKSIPLQLQSSIDAGYSTPSVPSRKKIKHPPLSVIAHHSSTRLRNTASTKSVKKGILTPLKEKSKKTKTKKIKSKMAGTSVLATFAHRFLPKRLCIKKYHPLQQSSKERYLSLS